jgi:hypothetical protein
MKALQRLRADPRSWDSLYVETIQACEHALPDIAVEMLRWMRICPRAFKIAPVGLIAVTGDRAAPCYSSW